MTFNYRELYFPCACGRKVTAIHLGLTSDMRLFVEWRCPCGKPDRTLLTFEQLVELMPPPATPDVTAFDQKFCENAKIALESIT